MVDPLKAPASQLKPEDIYAFFKTMGVELYPHQKMTIKGYLDATAALKKMRASLCAMGIYEYYDALHNKTIKLGEQMDQKLGEENRCGRPADFSLEYVKRPNGSLSYMSVCSGHLHAAIPMEATVRVINPHKFDRPPCTMPVEAEKIDIPVGFAPMPKSGGVSFIKNLSWAITALRSGWRKARRKEWPLGMVIVLVEGNPAIRGRDYFMCHLGCGDSVPWTPTHTDLLAEDWEVK